MGKVEETEEGDGFQKRGRDCRKPIREQGVDDEGRRRTARLAGEVGWK